MNRQLFGRLRKKAFCIIVIGLAACAGNYPNATQERTLHPSPTEIQHLVIEITAPPNGSPWSIYDPDPEHLWNRVFRQFFERTGRDGITYGWDEIDPLLWWDTQYLLEGDSHQQAIQVLDDFLDSRGEKLITDPLKRAMFQRDLWAVFDWLAFQTDPDPAQRVELEKRLAQIIRRVALTPQEIQSLPDNYTEAVQLGGFATDFSSAYPDTAFLPPGLFDLESGWVPIGREGGPVAMSHTEVFPFFGRSVFLVFYRHPDGREATLDFINRLNTEEKPALPEGLDVALVRRTLLIDDHGNLMASPLIESVQIRHYRPPLQTFYEFSLNRTGLFDEAASGLQPVQHFSFVLFFGHGDVFQAVDSPYQEFPLASLCKGCHFSEGGLVRSILSASRMNFPLADNQTVVLNETNWENETQTIIGWKSRHETWQTLIRFWNSEIP